MKFGDLPAELITIMKDVVREIAGHIHSDVVRLTQTDYDNLFWAIFSAPGDQTKKAKSRTHSAIELLKHLNDYIISHRNNPQFYGLKLREPVQIRRPKPPLRQGNLKLLPLLEQCDRKLLQEYASKELFNLNADVSARFWKTSDWTVYLGRLLYCAMRFGGLLRDDLKSALLTTLLEGKPYCHHDVIWFELTGKAGETQLWLPDPVSLLLLNVFYQAKQHILQLPLGLAHQKCLRDFFRREGHAELATMSATALQDLMLARLSLNITPCLLPVMADQAPNLTLDPVSFYRLLGCRYPRQDEAAADVEEWVNPKYTERPEFTKSQTALSSCADTMKKVRGLLRSAATKLQQAENTKGRRQKSNDAVSLTAFSQEIRKIAEDRDANLLPVTRDLIGWTAHRLVNQSHWSGKIRPKSLLSLLGSIFEPLARQFKEQKIETLSAEAIDDAYFEIIDGAANIAGKTKRARILRDFHIYLMKTYGLAQSYVFSQTIVKGERDKAILVDANILLPAEYGQAMAYLAGQSSDVAKAQSVLLMLGFRCGLRRSEAYMLRFTDIEIQRDIEQEWRPHSVVVVVRPHEERGLKSTSATRRVPLGLLATADEIALLFDFMKSRVFKGQGAQYLFSQNNAHAELYPDEQLFGALVQLLQIITDDSTFRFHRLRHSFVTWLYWYWQQDKYPHAFPLKTQLQHPLKAHLRAAKAKYFHQESGAANRKVLHAISLMTGHSGPSITTFHYLHSMHWASVAECWRDHHFSREREIELLGLNRRKVFRYLEQGHLGGLVAKQLQPFCHAIPEATKTQGIRDKIHDHFYGLSDSRFYQALHFYQNNFAQISLEDVAKRFLVDSDRLKAAVEALHKLAQKKPLKRRSQQYIQQVHNEDKPLNSPHVRLPIWPCHRRDAALTQQIFKIYHKLTPEKQSMVLAAASYVVWVCPGKFSDFRFFYKKRLQDFIKNIKPILQQLEPEHKLKLSLRNKAAPDAPVRQSLMRNKGLNQRTFKRMVMRHPQYLFIENRAYVSLNLTRVQNEGTQTPRNSDYGLKTALIALYYLNCRSNPHINFYAQNYNREVPIVGSVNNDVAVTSIDQLEP